MRCFQPHAKHHRPDERMYLAFKVLCVRLCIILLKQKLGLAASTTLICVMTTRLASSEMVSLTVNALMASLEMAPSVKVGDLI